MTNRPAVSVIIIFFNAVRFLAEAIESVLRQTEPDWELVLADDGSTDGSSEVALRYSRMLQPKIRYIDHPGHSNRGMSATRNLGIRNSSGACVAFLDADDVWEPDKLAGQLRLLARWPRAGLLYGSPLYWSSWSPELSNSPDHRPGIGVPAESLLHPPTLFLCNYPIGNGPAPCPSDLIVRREVIARVGGFEESFGGANQMYEDQAFLAKVYLTTPVFVSGACWTRYRQHPGACCSQVSASGQYWNVRRFFLEYLERYLGEQGIEDVEIRRAVDAAWWPYRHPHLSRARDVCRRAQRRMYQLLTARTASRSS